MDWKTYKARNDQKQKKSKVIIFLFIYYILIQSIFHTQKKIDFFFPLEEKDCMYFRRTHLCAILADSKQVR